ncbi:MAG: protein translocase subunit SecD [Patescibacteria group bacterium]|nr:protein translocase subunit SecD [Patescibacteria group bacterium]MCL5093616.1 protein translocase subunit SecD [Patescibacteria group bacterium]
MKKRRVGLRFIILFLITALAVFIALPKTKVNLKRIGIDFEKEYDIVRGLDLQGGTHLVYEADLSKIGGDQQNKAMQSLEENISRRVNTFGVAEPNIYSSKVGESRRLVVELPGVQNVDQAMDLIGKTAQLEFKEVGESGFIDTSLDGSQLESAEVTYDQNTNKPQVSINFKSEGAKIFAELTKKNLNKPLAILLDGTPLTVPTVQSEITNGKAVITGEFTAEEAKKFEIQLNSGALPVPVKNIEQRTVGASLGRRAVLLSLAAGILGIIVVSIYMLIYYRFLGIFSTIGLGLYLAYMIAIFKVIPVTLTMGGVAGLLLSVGMSMETDVLIFERIREELRHGKSLGLAINLGFQKAWPSIRDSNAVSLIICLILYFFGSGLIRGFAVVLALGIGIGLLTTFLGTRTFIDLVLKRRFIQKNALYRVERTEGLA